MNIKSEITVKGEKYIFKSSDIEKIFSVRSYSKIKNRTDKFFLYERKNINKKSVILFNERSMQSYLDGKSSKIIALKQRPWIFEEILSDYFLKELNISNVKNYHIEEVKKILNYDSMTEGDSLRFFNHVASSNISAPDEIWPVLFLWLRDEQNHHRGFEAIYKQLFGRSEKERKIIDSEPSNFLPFESILSDPFKTLVALSYDEAATISGYLNDMPIYREISPKVASFVERVISDEGWHLSKFAAMAAKYWPERLDELDDILDEACKSDGKNYQRTFFLDHDPSVEPQFDNSLMERAKVVSKKIILAKGKIKGFEDVSTRLDYVE